MARVSQASPPGRRRRATAIVVTGCLVLLSAASLAASLVSAHGEATTGEPSRPPTAAEAGRLATMRLHNFHDGVAAVRGTLGHPAAALHLTGWIDWRQPLAYLSVTAPTPSPADGLVQARPEVIAVRPGRPRGAASASAPAATTAASGTTVPGEPAAGGTTVPREPAAGATAPPPAQPPADGWRLRPIARTGSADAALDATLLLLFGVAADQVDVTDLIVHEEIRWLRTDTVDGVTADVLLGPAVPPGDATAQPPAAPLPGLGSLAAYGGAIRYWVDADARLRRLQAVVGGNLPLRLDFDRADQPALTAIDLLGGRANSPRPVSAAEAETLARLPRRNWAAGGVGLSIELPGESANQLPGESANQLPGESANRLTAAGWLDWRRTIAYLAVHDTGAPDNQTLVRADPAGVATLAGTGRTADGRPPLSPPRGSWQWKRWGQGRPGQLDSLLRAALALTGPDADDADRLRRTAVWLRTDLLHGAPVTVYEVPNPAAGDGTRLRCWIATDGGLRRLEVPGPHGTFGHLDVRPEQVPRLPAIPASG